MGGRVLGVALAAVPALPGLAAAAGDGFDPPLWTATPFALLLLAIAVLPLVAPHFWHKNRYKALVAAVLSLPVVIYLVNAGPEEGPPHLPFVEAAWDDLSPGVKSALSRAGTHALLHELGEYASFIILLGSLYTVAGGILVRGDLRGRPLTNTFILGLGAVLANLIGTTGASMVLVRPFLRINRQRQRVRHLPVFFIFLVSNLGGLLTPLGDPPLFLGFLKGVDFLWTLTLWPQWLVANGAVLALFLAWDTAAYLREPRQALVLDAKERRPLRVVGLVNVIFLAGILAAVLFQSESIAGGVQAWLSRFFPCPSLLLHRPYAELAMLGMAVLSLYFTPRGLRPENGFGWGAIIEVAVLFAGIFVTMVPALAWLARHGGEFGVSEPWQYFWLTGTLSSFLDNAPTYLTFATLAAGPHDLPWLMREQPLLLAAISCGAVFMGANTYIGNGPNFMVKAIADESGIPAPSFFGYMAYSSLILLPIFVLVTFLFFTPG